MTTHTVIDGKRVAEPEKPSPGRGNTASTCEATRPMRRITILGDRAIVTEHGRDAVHLCAEQTEALVAFVDLLIAGEGCA